MANAIKSKITINWFWSCPTFCRYEKGKTNYAITLVSFSVSFKFLWKHIRKCNAIIQIWIFIHECDVMDIFLTYMCTDLINTAPFDMWYSYSNTSPDNFIHQDQSNGICQISIGNILLRNKIRQWYGSKLSVYCLMYFNDFHKRNIE